MRRDASNSCTIFTIGSALPTIVTVACFIISNNIGGSVFFFLHWSMGVFLHS